MDYKNRCRLAVAGLAKGRIYRSQPRQRLLPVYADIDTRESFQIEFGRVVASRFHATQTDAGRCLGCKSPKQPT